jgi:predicted nucleotidyltransferase
LRKNLKGIDNIKKAYIYGSYAKDKMDVHSDIDLLIIGNHDIVPLQRRLNKIQKEINREINVVNMSQGELLKRMKNKDPFIKEVFRHKNIRVV